MNKLVTTILLLFITLSYSQEKLNHKIEVPFTQTPNGHIIIPAKINGVEGHFIFDTGAGLNLLTKKFADQVVDLKETHHFYTGHRATGEEIQSDLWESKSLEIAGFTVDNELFAVYDLEFPLDGLISLTPFKNQPITIDFENKVLVIETERSLNELEQEKDFEMPIQITDDRGIAIDIATTVQLNDHLKLNVRLDSGAGFNVFRFSSRYMEHLGVEKDKIDTEFRPSMFKPEQGNNYYHTTLSKMIDLNNHVSVTDFKVTFIEGLIYEGIMGINWIGQKITIDIPSKKLLVQH